MDRPQRGVYFFMEDGEERTDSGTGLRVVCPTLPSEEFRNELTTHDLQSPHLFDSIGSNPVPDVSTKAKRLVERSWCATLASDVRAQAVVDIVGHFVILGAEAQVFFQLTPDTCLSGRAHYPIVRHPPHLCLCA
jgi:hypothetical protein